MKENESGGIPWHPSFAAALQLELKEYEDQLEFLLEYALTTAPLKVDVIVLKETSKPLDKNIAYMFRTYNIVEYKSPKDYLSIDDFYKGLAYVYLYKQVAGTQHGVDTIDIREMTLTMVSYNMPEKLFQHLNKREKHFYSHQKGVYYIEGADIPIQLVIQSELPETENEYLTVLTDQLTEKEPLQHVLDEYLQDNKNELYRLVLHAIYRANPDIVTEVIEMQKLESDPDIQKKIDDVVRKFEWDKKWKEEGREEGREEGVEKAKLEMARVLIKEGKSVEYISRLTGLSESAIKEL